MTLRVLLIGGFLFIGVGCAHSGGARAHRAHGAGHGHVGEAAPAADASAAVAATEPKSSVMATQAVPASAGGIDACKIQKNKKLEMETISANIANINNTRTSDGAPYKRKKVVCDGQDCKVIAEEKFMLVYEPTNKNSDVNGYVAYPDINMMDEMRGMIEASKVHDSAEKECLAKSLPASDTLGESRTE